MSAARPQDGGPERALLERLLARDEQAFLEFVDRHHGGLLRVAQSIVRSPSAAEEVAQETWRAFVEGLETFEQRSSLKTFLYRILTNQARTRASRDGRTTTVSDLEEEEDEASPLAERFAANGHWLAPVAPWSADTADALLARKQAMGALMVAMEALPERLRAVVQLRDVEELPAEEVCEILEVTEGHQRVLLHRARTRLRVALEAHFDA